MKNFKLKREDCLILFIDIQDKLLNAIYEKEKVLNKSIILAQMANIMKLESVITVQYPKGLGYTNENIKNILKETKEIEKKSFSCILNDEFKEKLKNLNKKQIILCGIEAHICLLLTARDLLDEGYEVFIASDATGSRDKNNYLNALSQLKDMGCVVTNIESIMFDLNSIAGTDEFKKIQKLII